METKTVNKELWEVGALFISGGTARQYISTEDGEQSISVNTWNSNKGIADGKKMVELIVTAVNACKTINPDNPLAVAKVLPEMLEALDILYAQLSNHKVFHPEEFEHWENANIGLEKTKQVRKLLKQKPII